MKMALQYLAAKARFFMASIVLVAATNAHAGIPVIDATNVSQNVIQAMQAIAEVEQLIKSYQTQLQQYENMLRNTVAPAAYIWDQANSVINKLLSAQDTLNYYKNQAGSIENYLSKWKNVNEYRSSPCFNLTASCTDADRAALAAANASSAESVKRANDAVLKALDKQQDALGADARTLERLQSQAGGAMGQMEAIQAGNQLASASTNSLLQIRALLMASQAAIASRDQQVADREAQQAAAGAKLREGSFTRSTAKSW